MLAEAQERSSKKERGRRLSASVRYFRILGMAWTRLPWTLGPAYYVATIRSMRTVSRELNRLRMLRNLCQEEPNARELTDNPF
jgi:hypothetical protein